MASASGGAGVWRVTGEDRAKHDSQFYQLKPVNGFVTGEQAKNFFMQSGLPTPVLGQIWSLADFNNDGKMDRKEFSIAMYLIKKKLQGFELPKSLPASLKMDPSPVMGSFGTMQSGAMSMGPTPPMGATPPMAAPGMGTPPMNMGMPIMSMAPTSMTASSLAMPIMANGVTPAMGQTNFMVVPPSMGSPATMMDTKPRSGSFNTPMPGVGSSPVATFAMPHQSKLKYTQVFNTNDRNKRGHLTGVEARALLVQLGLPQPILAQIWALSDIDKDGKLTCDEFCIAMFLCDLAKTGVPLPAVLPAELMPGKARSGSFGPAQPPPQVAAPQNDSFGDLLGGMGMAPSPIQPLATNGESKDEEDKLAAMVTFEDRRKENFAKGQAELDRRRQMLQDQMKRENEARLEKERQEQEKRERYRQEQERKRQMELERHMEKQRQMEREREEQRQKMLEQREAARRELERQRQVEWERQRKEQLLAEKGREYEQLGAVKSRASNLRCELESLQGKKSEIDQKIIKVRQGVTDFTTNIEAMRIIRDGKINDIDKIEKDIKNLSDRLLQVQTERESLDYRVQTTSQSNPLSEPHRTVLHAVELKKTAIQKLKKELEDIERDTESNLVEIDNSNSEMTEMNSKINSLQQDISSLQRQQNQKQAEVSQVKRRLEEEAQNHKKQEKEKQEKLRKELEAQRLKEQEKKKKAETSQDSAWFAFGNDNKPATSANNDIWSSAFASVQSETSTTTDTWASAFSSQSQNAPAAQSSSAGKKGRNFKALYPFDARNPDELNLNPGDTVWIPDDQSGADEGWMSGEKNGKKGWFPKDYVEVLPESESSQAATDAFSDNTSTEQPANFGRFDGVDESPFESSSASPTPGQGQTAPDGLQAQVLYPWKAKKDNHLSFNKGDIINVKEQQELWWFGELSGQTGWFPKSYVKLVSGPATTNSSKQSSRSGTPQTNAFAATASSSSRSTPVVIEPKLEEVSEAFVAIFSYTSTEPGDLVFNQGDLIMVTKKDGDWWTGSLGDTTGIFPANYVKKSEQPVAPPPQPATPPVQQPQQSLSANAQPQQQSQQKTSTSSTLKKPEIASVIAAYSATGPEQLSLQPGQIIQVRKKSPSGWWEGELQARGQKRKIGWFPANYVKLLGSSARSTPDSSSQRNSPANTLSRSATPSIPPPQPQSIQTESKYVDQVIALYPYVPQHDDELTFHKDAVINVINKDDANWWKGEVNGVVGVFPSNYVGPLTLSPPQENTWSSDPDVLAQTSAIESKRQNYIHELINTEETYMSDMSIVLDAFRKPMSEAKVMTEEELETVFVNWTELILCNTKLLKSVRVRKKMCGKGQVIQVIGDILCENLPHMTAYIRFCSCQLNAAALIQRKTENSPEFKEIQKKCVQDNRTKGMPLSSFLLKPMQRITKYPLMIQKILQYTPEGHPDHQNLQDALAKAEELCSQVNEGVRERENCDKLEWIQSRVQCDGLTEKLVFNSITNCLGPRKLLYTSTVYKAKSNKELVAFLFNDFLLLTVPLSSSASTFVFDPKTKSQFKMYKNPIFLNEIMVKKVGEEDGEPFIFQVSMVDNRTYNLKTSNQTERDSWVRHTEAASRLYLDTEKKKKESAYSLRRITGVGRLLVVLLEGCDLIASDANGKSDPYCEVSMGVQEHKTKVINATLNPKWNASMQFTIKDVEQDVLCITVFDRDLFSPNDFLGRTEVRVKDIMVESKQRKGPITKRLLLHEVSKGEVVVKLDLQLYDNT